MDNVKPGSPSPTFPVSGVISVIIPHYNDLVHLRQCLTALAGQAAPQGYSFEILVADNNSTCGLSAVEQVAHEATGTVAKVILAVEQGAGPARNAAVAVSQGDILAFIDSDCIAEPGWLAAGVAALSHYDFVGGRVAVGVQSESAMTYAEAFERVFAFDNGAYIARKGFTGSGNLFCPKSVFVKVGGFRKTLSEDVEWSHRARAMGFRLGYAPDAIVVHPARDSWAALLQKWRRITREGFALRQDRKESRWRWLALTWLLPASIVPHTIKALRSPALQGAGNRMRAVGGLVAHRAWRFWDQHLVLWHSFTRKG